MGHTHIKVSSHDPHPASRMFDKLSDNLNVLMAEAHISADELGRRTGLPASTIKKIRNRYNPNPTLSTLLPLATFFAISLDQLIGNAPLPTARLKGQHTIHPATLQWVPLITWEQSITWLTLPTSTPSTQVTIATESRYSDEAYALMVEEEDWANLTKGTALIVDPTLKPEHRDFVIVYKVGQRIPTAKQVLLDEEKMYLKSLIEGYTIAPLTPEHAILGIIVEFRKNLRQPLPFQQQEAPL